MTAEEIILHTEALIFASDKPLATLELATILADVYPEGAIDIDKILVSIEALKEKYNTEYYAFGLKEVGGGHQFLSKSNFHATVSKLNGDKFLKRLSTAALETLAIIAYKQPITKPDVEYIRGVSCDYSIQKLLEKELILITGRNEEAVGKTLLYSTSKSFMDYLGINNMDELPKLREVIGEDIVIPTLSSEALPDTTMVVNDTGTLLEVLHIPDLPATEDNAVATETIESTNIVPEESTNNAENDTSENALDEPTNLPEE